MSQDSDNPEWTVKDFEKARKASEVLDPQISKLLVRQSDEKITAINFHLFHQNSFATLSKLAA